LICVSVCSFTFRFESKDEIREYISFFEKKTHLTSRIPDFPEGGDAFFRWHSQCWYERLPMYLQEEAKKVKIVKALYKAIALWETGKLQIGLSARSVSDAMLRQTINDARCRWC